MILEMINTLNSIKDKVLPEDEELFISVRIHLHTLAFPPIQIVPAPSLNPVDINLLLLEIKNATI
jgi:hypothetical protein